MTQQERVRQMNIVFKLPTNSTLVDHGNERLLAFECVIHKELTELDLARRMKPGLDRYVAIADLLGDVMVYVRSEAERWGIPIDEVFDAIMDSQESKLVDGKPIMSPDGTKFDKGPNYQPPEGKIKEILSNYYRPGW